MPGREVLIQEASDNEENIRALPDNEMRQVSKQNDSKFRNNKILLTGHIFGENSITLGLIVFKI